MKRLLIILAAAATFSWAAAHCGADTLSYQGTDGTRKADVTFDLQGNNLSILLSNISTGDVVQPDQVLTGVFFNIVNNPSLLSGPNPHKAKLNTGSSVVFGSAGSDGNVGGEWAYRENATGLGSSLPNYDYGISSSGLDLFGPGDRFDTSQNLQGPDSVGGLEYGLLSAGDNLTTGNTPVTGSNALIKNTVVFNFTVLPTSFRLSDISSIRFQYGTDLREPSFTGSVVPEPGTLGVLGLAVAPLATRLRRRRRASQV